MRSAVVLPQPDGPTKTTNSPSAIVEVELGDGLRAVPVDLRQLLELDLRHAAPCGRNLDDQRRCHCVTIPASWRSLPAAAPERAPPAPRRHLLEERRVLAPAPDRAGGHLRRRRRRRPARLGDLPQPDRRDRRLAVRQLRRLRQLHDAWHDQNFRNALENTLIITFASQAIVVVGAGVLSHCLVRDFRGKWFLRFLVILPVGGAGRARDDRLALDLRLAVHDRELDAEGDAPARRRLRRLRRSTAAEPPTRRSGSATPKLAMFAIIVVHAWRILPFAIVIFIAGLASIPTRGRRRRRRSTARPALKKFWYVTLPLQLPIALVAVLFGIVFTAADFAVVYILTHGGPFNSTQVLTTWAFTIGIESGSLGAGRGDLALPASRCSRAVDDPDALLRASGRRCRDVRRAARDAGRRPARGSSSAPFAIVLAFPFYWMLTTMFKHDLDLYNAQTSRTLQRRLGSRALGLLELHDVPPRLVPVQAHRVPDLAPEHRDRRGRRRGDHARARAAGRLRARPAVRRLGPERRRRRSSSSTSSRRRSSSCRSRG